MRRIHFDGRQSVRRPIHNLQILRSDELDGGNFHRSVGRANRKRRESHGPPDRNGAPAGTLCRAVTDKLQRTDCSGRREGSGAGHGEHLGNCKQKKHPPHPLNRDHPVSMA
jgi:hypothetical protein